MSEKDDFYIDEKGLAAYFEAAWFGKFQALGQVHSLASKSKTVPDAYIDSPYFRDVSAFIANCCQRQKISPKDLLEVGPALGRVCYETVKAFSSLSKVVLVEPSHRLISGLERLLLNGGKTSFPYIYSLHQLNRISVDTSVIADECEHVNFKLIRSPMTEALVREEFDLVYCLNVIDNSSSPSMIVESIKRATKNNGVLVLGCTYQWSKNHLQNLNEAVDDINEYFDASWEKLDEAEFDYKFRYNERYSNLFSSHVVIYKK